MGFGRFSTAAHWGISGVVPPDFSAAGAAAAAAGFCWAAPARPADFGVQPDSLTICPSFCFDRATFRNSLASSWFLPIPATAKFEPPRKTPSGLAAVSPGMVKKPMSFLISGLALTAVAAS